MSDQQTGQMTELERLQGRATHAEARAAAAEQREAQSELQFLIRSLPQMVEATAVLRVREGELAAALEADKEFRQQVGERLGLDLSDPSRVNVNWATGEISLEPDVGAETG